MSRAQDVLDYIDHAEWRLTLRLTGRAGPATPGVERLLDHDRPPVVRRRVWRQLRDVERVR